MDYCAISIADLHCPFVKVDSLVDFCSGSDLASFRPPFCVLVLDSSVLFPLDTLCGRFIRYGVCTSTNLI